MAEKLIRHKKDILYTACFLGLVLVDWARSNTPGNVWAVAVNCGGLLLGAMTLVDFSWGNKLGRKTPPNCSLVQYRGQARHMREKLSICFLAGYGIVWLLGSVAGYILWMKAPGQIYQWQYITGALNAGWIGLLLLGILLDKVNALRSGQKIPLRFGIEAIAAVLWALMTFTMMFSPSGHLWAVWYFGMFLAFYSLEFTEKERKSLWNGMANGIILGFFVLQIFAFGFRPYDDVRYRGAYINCNMNALFYLVAYAMVLYRLHDLKLREPERKAKLLCKALWYLLAGGLLGLIFFTLSRTALLATVVVTAVYGVVTSLAVYKTGMGKMLKQWLILGACFLISFPLVYLTIRYLPTVLHHPVWLVGEYAETKVHSYDPADSDKYVSMDEFLEEAFGRLNYRGILDKLGSVGSMTAYAKTGSAEETLQGNCDGSLQGCYAKLGPAEELATVNGTSGNQEPDPLLPKEEWGDSGKVRMAIYRDYWERLNLWGHSVEEGRIRITQGYYAWHAQNVFLQIAFFYGAPAGLLFTVLVALTGILAFKRALRGRESEAVLPMLVWLVFVAFGLLEVVWNPGQLVLFLFFFVQKQHTGSEPSGREYIAAAQE